MGQLIVRLMLATMLLVTASQPASASALQFVCTYPKHFDWKDAKLDEASDFVLSFSFDAQNKQAFLTDKQGTEEVNFVSGAAGITFIEVLPTGAVQTTTVSKGGKSVHSRHTIVLGKLVPSQYFGECTSSN
jgi:hypothetical protein